jgi:hypothetical protein
MAELQLRRGNKRLLIEREILAKAAAWFAKGAVPNSKRSSNSGGRTRPPCRWVKCAGCSRSPVGSMPGRIAALGSCAQRRGALGADPGDLRALASHLRSPSHTRGAARSVPGTSGAKARSALDAPRVCCSAFFGVTTPTLRDFRPEDPQSWSDVEPPYDRPKDDLQQ